MKIKFDLVDYGIIFILVIAIVVFLFGCDSKNAQSEYIIISKFDNFYVDDYIIKDGVLYLNDLNTNDVYVVSGDYLIKPNMYK